MSGGSQREAQSHFYPYEAQYHFIYQSLTLPEFSVLLYNSVDSLGMILSFCPVPVSNALL